jgi:4-carboxymuconolactone decarboxylase
MKIANISVLIAFMISLISINKMNAQTLDAKAQGIVTISAFTAKGDLPHLKTALNGGLDAGLTINEIKEVLVQLYAYCGFPRSLNSINTFMTVLDERKANGIHDTEGEAGKPVTGADKYEQGKKTLETLVNMPLNGPLTGANAFAPGIDIFLKEHLFADIFGRGVLSHMQRELATITVLSTLSGVEAQLQAHLGMGMNVGITEGQLNNVYKLIAAHIGETEADSGKAVLAKVLTARKQ